jgi:hypothetical protein
MRKRHMDGPNGFPLCGAKLRFPMKGSTWRKEAVTCERCKRIMRKKEA